MYICDLRNILEREKDKQRGWKSMLFELMPWLNEEYVPSYLLVNTISSSICILTKQMDIAHM